MRKENPFVHLSRTYYHIPAQIARTKEGIYLKQPWKLLAYAACGIAGLWLTAKLLLPIGLPFLLGYALSYLAGGSEGVCVAVSFLALLLSGLILVLSQRKKKHQQAFTFDIVR